MRELQLVTRPAGRSHRLLNRLTRERNRNGNESRASGNRNSESSRTEHRLDPVAHWAIKDGDQCHELVRGENGRARFSRRKWNTDEEREIRSRSTFMWTDGPRGGLEKIGEASAEAFSVPSGPGGATSSFSTPSPF